MNENEVDDLLTKIKSRDSIEAFLWFDSFGQPDEVISGLIACKYFEDESRDVLIYVEGQEAVAVPIRVKDSVPEVSTPDAFPLTLKQLAHLIFDGRDGNTKLCELYKEWHHKSIYGTALYKSDFRRSR